MHPLNLAVPISPAHAAAPIALFTLGAVVAAAAVFTFAERRWRERWSAVPLDRHAVPDGPYRSVRVVAGHLSRAPALVRVAALASIAFAQVFLPALVFALAVMPFDGIAIALGPGVLVTGASWVCGLMLLKRRSGTTQTARSVALASLIASFWLIALCLVHVGLVEYDPNYGISQASNSVPVVAFVFAVASAVHARLLLVTLRTHGKAIEWGAQAA